MASSFQENYTNRAAVGVGEVSVNFCGYRVLRGQRNRSLSLLISVFYTEVATFSFK
jgi:hypothetical protein